MNVQKNILVFASVFMIFSLSVSSLFANLYDGRKILNNIASIQNQFLSRFPEIMIPDKVVLLKYVDARLQLFQDESLTALREKNSSDKIEDIFSFVNKCKTQIKIKCGAIASTKMNCWDIINSFAGFSDQAQVKLIDIADVQAEKEINRIFFESVYGLITDIIATCVQDNKNAMDFVREVRQSQLNEMREISKVARIDFRLEIAVRDRYRDELERIIVRYFGEGNQK